MDESEAQRVIARILQLHTAEPYQWKMVPNGPRIAVCSHCRREDGKRVKMPCPTTAIIRPSTQRP